MITDSSVTAKFKRRSLHKRTKFAVADALRLGAMQLPVGRLRKFIAGKAKRLETCAATQYDRLITPKDGPSFVASSNQRACQIRGLCMGCEARRAAALAADMADLFPYIWDIAPGCRALMLTLTSRNRPLAETRAMVLDHQKALKAFFGYHRVLTSTLGHVGNIEIDFTEKRGTITAHVHSHHIVMVEAEALSDHRYIRQAEYVALWQRALKAPYKPIVDIRAIKGPDGSSDTHAVRNALREVCKYCLDTDGFIHHAGNHMLVSPEVAVAFAVATHRRRLTSMDRIFMAARKRRATARKADAHTHAGPNPPPDPEHRMNPSS